MEEIYTFGGNPLDRASAAPHRYRPGSPRCSTIQQTRLLPMRELKPLVRPRNEPALDWQEVAPWRGLIEAGATLIFLGLNDGRAFSRSTPAAPTHCPIATPRRRRPRPGAADPGRRGGDPGRGAVADRLARAPRLLRPVRRRDPIDQAGWERRCPQLPGAALSARRPGHDHAHRARRVRAARAQQAPAGLAVLLPRRVHGAGRDARGGGAPRGARRSRDRVGRVQIPRLAALAVSVDPDDGVPRRGDQRRDHGRPRGDRRGALVPPRGNPRDGRPRRDRPRRSDPGVDLAAALGDRPPDCAPLVVRVDASSRSRHAGRPRSRGGDADGRERRRRKRSPIVTGASAGIGLHTARGLAGSRNARDPGRPRPRTAPRRRALESPPGRAARSPRLRSPISPASPRCAISPAKSCSPSASGSTCWSTMPG